MSSEIYYVYDCSGQIIGESYAGGELRMDMPGGAIGKVMYEMPDNTTFFIKVSGGKITKLFIVPGQANEREAKWYQDDESQFAGSRIVTN